MSAAKYLSINACRRHGFYSCIGSDAPAEHALGLLKAALTAPADVEVDRG